MSLYRIEITCVRCGGLVNLAYVYSSTDGATIQLEECPLCKEMVAIDKVMAEENAARGKPLPDNLSQKLKPVK